MLDAHERKVEFQKWDYITLADFRSRSCWNFISYGWLWFLAIVAVAVYGSDTFTAVQLLVYDNWNSDIQPTIPFSISRWIFAGCILFSWVLCIYEWVRALRVMKRANVAESYLDPLAVVLQSMRLGGVGKGWRRFLVFAALTKSKKGADYVALFSYFQFKGAIRVVIAEGPRQVINALTLYSVMKANIIPTGPNSGNHPAVEQFFINLEALYDEHKRQAIILSTMLFTLVIWVFSALSLLASILLYIGFLWHYIPREDGSLSRYCRRKVNTRLERIVNANAKTAISEEEAKRVKAEQKMAASAGAIENGDFVPKGPIRQATLPLLNDNDAIPLKEPLTRTSSISTSPPPYGSPTSDTEDGRQPTLPDLTDTYDQPVPIQRLARAGTDSTVASNVAYGRPPAPIRQETQSTVMSNVAFAPPRPVRSGSQSTIASNISFGPPLYGNQMPSAGPQPPMRRPVGPPRSYTQSSSASDRPLLNREPSAESMARDFGRVATARPPLPLQQGDPGPLYEMSPPRRAPTAPLPHWQQHGPPDGRNSPIGQFGPPQPSMDGRSSPMGQFGPLQPPMDGRSSPMGQGMRLPPSQRPLRPDMRDGSLPGPFGPPNPRAPPRMTTNRPPEDPREWF